MTIRRSLVAALAPLLLAGAASAQQAKPDFAGELKGLQEEFQKAQAAYNAARQQGKGGEDPNGAFLPKYLDLARRAKGTNEGVKACALSIPLASRTTEAKKALEETATLVVPAGLAHPAVAEFAGNLRFYGWSMGLDRRVEILRAIGEKAAAPDAKAAGLFGVAVLYAEDASSTPAQRKEARALFGRVMEEFPKSGPAREAKGYVFDLEHLQVGMQAPDFEAVDGDGVKFRLSQYRGKVVLLDFWGFW